MKQKIKKYLPDGVYGAIDGVVTTFAIIGGVYGANLSPLVVLVLGISNVLADGFSMASSNFLAKNLKKMIDITTPQSTQRSRLFLLL